MLEKLKTIVARGAMTKGQNALSVGVAPGGRTLQDLMAQAKSVSSKLFDEKEWQCPCGHKFRAGGDWVACAPIHCEVPSCPNPKYYIDGPGRALLEANPQGVRLKEVCSKTDEKIGPNSTTKNSMLGRLGKK